MAACNSTIDRGVDLNRARDNEEVPIYLETTENNVQLYKKIGSEVLKEIKLSESDSVYPKILSKSVNIAKKTTLALKVTLARIDNLIEEAHSTIEPDQRTEITNFLMGLRLKVHSMIDDTIRFKNSSRKAGKN